MVNNEELNNCFFTLNHTDEFNIYNLVLTIILKFFIFIIFFSNNPV